MHERWWVNVGLKSNFYEWEDRPDSNRDKSTRAIAIAHRLNLREAPDDKYPRNQTQLGKEIYQDAEYQRAHLDQSVEAPNEIFAKRWRK